MGVSVRFAHGRAFRSSALLHSSAVLRNAYGAAPIPNAKKRLNSEHRIQP